MRKIGTSFQSHRQGAFARPRGDALVRAHDGRRAHPARDPRGELLHARVHGLRAEVPREHPVPVARGLRGWLQRARMHRIAAIAMVAVSTFHLTPAHAARTEARRGPVPAAQGRARPDPPDALPGGPAPAARALRPLRLHREGGILGAHLGHRRDDADGLHPVVRELVAARDAEVDDRPVHGRALLRGVARVPRDRGLAPL